MNKTQAVYYAINQLLVGNSLIKLPEEVQAFFPKVDLNQLQRSVDKLPKLRLTGIESVILNLARTPEYSSIVLTSQEGSPPMTLESLIKVCRDPNTEIGALYTLLGGLITEQKQSTDGTIYVQDGVLYMPKDSDEDVDFAKVAERVFYLYVWGTTDVTDEVKSLVILLDQILNAEQEFSLTPTILVSIVEKCVNTGIHPTTFAKTAFFVQDVQSFFETTGAIAWWGSWDQMLVKMLTSNGYKSKAVVSVYSFESFVALYQDTALFEYTIGKAGG